LERIAFPVTFMVELAVIATVANVPVMVGEAENTRFVLVVPVVPEAVKPVMLLNDVMLAVVAFVPPLATGSAVPEYAIASVPAAVIGEPVTLRNAGTVAATLVTVPTPVTVTQVGAPAPFDFNTCPEVPATENAYAEPVP
jgi:hypothetical protein